MSEGFLSRWSRRKDEARRAEGGSGPPPDETAGPPPEAPQQEAEAPEAGSGGEAALAPDEIAALPSIDELTADSDITGFLRPGVPESLRNAALRRMWMLDPAIRDFAGHARDYDYDWNRPGGAPGSGALRPEDDVAAMVRRIFGERDAPAPPAGGRPAAAAEEAGGEGGDSAASDAGRDAQTGAPDGRGGAAGHAGA